MTQRERTLAIVVIGLIAAIAAVRGVGTYRSAVADSSRDLMSARERKAELELEVDRGRQAMQDFEAWQARSLPVDRQLALSVYRTLLVEQLKQAGLNVDDVEPARNTFRSDAYESSGFTVRGEGELSAVVAFLYAFHTSPQLHKIVELRLLPKEDSSSLKVTLKVEALIVQGSASTGLAQSDEPRSLPLGDLAAYVQQIVSRNVFVPYAPPKPPAERAVQNENQPDDAAEAYVTAIFPNGERMQVWITVRTTNEMLRLYEGDRIRVGKLRGRVAAIRPRAIEVQSREGRQLVPVGSNLREGRPLNPDGTGAAGMDPAES